LPLLQWIQISNVTFKEIKEDSQMENNNRPSTIDEALRLIDDVINRDGANLSELISSEYSNLRRAINDFAPQMGDRVRDYGTQAVDQASVYARQGIEQSRVVASKVDQQVRANPWPVIGGVALASLAAGFFLGRGGDIAADGDIH
jgi:ElaB/YqjD/DUF883 family membrane-anchored ribosome-binding protein